MRARMNFGYDASFFVHDTMIFTTGVVSFLAVTKMETIAIYSCENHIGRNGGSVS